jgi:hypothetical protein
MESLFRTHRCWFDYSYSKRAYALQYATSGLFYDRAKQLYINAVPNGDHNEEVLSMKRMFAWMTFFVLVAGAGAASAQDK